VVIFFKTALAESKTQGNGRTAPGSASAEAVASRSRQTWTAAPQE
jgi:hypothetical protein